MLGAAKAAAGAATATTAAKAVAVTGLSTVVALTVIVSSLLPGMGTKAAEGSTCGPEGGGGGGGTSAPQVSQEPSETAVADIPADYLKLYRSGAAEYGLDWAIVAAVGKIETDHGEDILNEGSGAAGPMQFMPSTWETAGLDANGDGVADINDPEDAIPSAAKYLRDSGAPEDYYTALFAYNNSDEYVNTVLAQADEYRAASGDDSTLALVQPAYTALTQGLVDKAGSGADLLGEAAAFPFTVRNADATMNSWDLVDENLNLHYESHTQFGSAVSHAASAWNGLGVVNVAPTPGGDETDVVIGDTYEEAAEYGWTTSDGRMYFVAYKAENSTENAVNALAVHEMGHAIGFDHTSEPSVMNTPITTNSDSNYDTPTDYDRGEYAERWGGSEAPSPDEQPQPSEAPEEGGGESGNSETGGGTFEGEEEGGIGGTFEGNEEEGPSPDTGSQELFEHMFGDNYTGTSSGGAEGSEDGNVNRQVQINNNSSQPVSQNGDGGSGGSSGGGGSNEADISGDPDGDGTGWPFNIFGDEPQGDSEGGGQNKGGDNGDGPTKNQYGDEGGGEGGEESGSKAVFPLPSDYHDDYQNDWGAARSQGGHEGTDIFAPDGTGIASITDGTVVRSGWDELGGNTVLIEATADVGPVKAGDVMYYAHMQSASPLQPGDTVSAGDSVGQVGSTDEGPPGTLLPDGRGKHLHLGWYDESGSRAEAASGAMNPFPLLEWLVDNGGEATGGPTAPGVCPEDPGGSPSGTPGSPEGSPEGGSSGGSGDGAAAVEEAKKYMGVPYVLGGPETCIPGEQMDCTCLTTTVFKAVGGYDLPDWPTDLFNYGEPVSEGDLQAGDVVIYSDPGDGTGGHVGIAMNSTEMVHACLPCGETVIGPIFDVPNYAGARRLV
jgi:murein DD-endopeptidase MepM/ murein hydrolase activator NlpD